MRAKNLDIAARQRADRRIARGDDHQIDVQAILLEQPGIFGDPQRNPAAGNRSVGDIESFELLSGGDVRAKQYKEKG